jgi:penicillin-insensitive murein endopeptidase
MDGVDTVDAVVVLGAIVLAGALLAGCMPWKALLPGGTGSIGTTSHGLLVEPDHLPARGENFRYYRAGDRRYGTPELVGLVGRVADHVARAHPGSVLMVGDLSSQTGGWISEHGSHRSGRDVDFGFYLSDPAGRHRSGTPLVKIDRFGVAVRARRAVRFDTERNWLAVEALLRDEQADVQWIFVSRGLKALLIEWALAHDRGVELARRAADVLHQPSDGYPHDDHFHVRIYCPRGESGRLCRDRGPVWPWIAKRDTARADGLTDEELMQLATEGLD